MAPLRRGRGESTGTYVEECSVYIGQCTTADQVALTDRGVREALLDTNAVIDQLILGRLVPRESKIVVAGHSRGGFLSLTLAAERPALPKAVINFSGGWLAITDSLSAVENQQRTEAQTVRLARAAKDAHVPTIWIYAVRDPCTRKVFHLSYCVLGARREGRRSSCTLPSTHCRTHIWSRRTPPCGGIRWMCF